MRTNIEIDEKTLNEVMKLCGFKTKKEAVEKSLEFMIKYYKKSGLKDLRGKIEWDGDLNDMRTER